MSAASPTLMAGVARLGEDSRAETAEAQLRAIKEEVAGLRRAHDLELSSLRTTHKDEIAAVKRAFDAERHAIDRSGVHSKQISGLAEQVGHALTGLSPSP